MAINRINRKLVTAVLGFAVVAGSGTGALVHQLNQDDAKPTAERPSPSATPSPSKSASKAATSPSSSPKGSSAPAATTAPAPSKDPSPVLQPVSSLTVTAGAVGPVEVGMSRQQALDSGYVVPDTDRPCEGDFLAWRQPYSPSLDIITIPNGSISSIGISGSEPRTRSGYGIGSTYGELKDVIEPVQPNDYDQAGGYVYDTSLDAYIGFLFDASVEEITDSTKVVFMEVSKHSPPGLLRDGC